MSMFRYLTFYLFCFSLAIPSNLPAQDLAPVNVVLVPKINNDLGERMIYSSVLSSVGNSSAIYHRVERELYDEIMQEREKAAKVKDDPYVATILKGAAVAVEFSIIEYKEVWDSFPVVAAAYGRDFDYRLLIECTYELRVLNIETSEIMHSGLFVARGAPDRKGGSFVDLLKHELRMSALTYVRRGVGKSTRQFLLKAINPAIPIFKYYKQDGLNKLLIAGGKGAAYPAGTLFRIVKETSIMINGVPVLRQETVGEAVVRENHSDFTECIVTELQGDLEDNSFAPYVLPSPKNAVPLDWFEKPNPQN